METILKYLPYVLLFAVATMIVYGWGLWRASRQNQDLANMLSAKGISAVKKVLKKGTTIECSNRSCGYKRVEEPKPEENSDE